MGMVTSYGEKKPSTDISIFYFLGPYLDKTP